MMILFKKKKNGINFYHIIFRLILYEIKKDFAGQNKYQKYEW